MARRGGGGNRSAAAKKGWETRRRGGGAKNGKTKPTAAITRSGGKMGKAAPSSAKQAMKQQRANPNAPKRGKLPGDELFNSLFRGKAARKPRGAKPVYEQGKGRYLKMQQAKRG